MLLATPFLFIESVITNCK